MTDFVKAHGLLALVRESLAHPKLRWLTEAAMAELEAMAPKAFPATTVASAAIMQSGQPAEVVKFKEELAKTEPQPRRV